MSLLILKVEKQEVQILSAQVAEDGRRTREQETERNDDDARHDLPDRTRSGGAGDRILVQTKHSAAGEQVMALLTELHGEGRTIVLVTHDEEVAAYAQRELLIRDGRIATDRAQSTLHAARSAGR